MRTRRTLQSTIYRLAVTATLFLLLTPATHANGAGGQAQSDGPKYTTVAGGQGNSATGNSATVGGGYQNKATSNSATVAGGQGNVAGGEFATVGGGTANSAAKIYGTVGGGTNNKALANAATVIGGFNNEASGDSATVAGGRDNVAAGTKSFAAGSRAKVANLHHGTFLFADSTQADFASAAANEFAVRATGGVRFVTALSNVRNGEGVGARLAAGSGAWSSLSDRDAKINFASINGGSILEKLAGLPIQSWNYRAQDASIRHLGPTAQDFYAAFRLGEDDRHISTVDADGVALAAIQELYRINQSQSKQIEQLRREAEQLRLRLARLEQTATNR